MYHYLAVLLRIVGVRYLNNLKTITKQFRKRYYIFFLSRMIVIISYQICC